MSAVDTAMVATNNGSEDSEQRRKLTLLKAVGLDRVSPEQRELAIAIAKRYDLDLLLKHIVMIEGKPYVTRDALLWIAHRDGNLDGIEVTEPTIRDYQGVDYWYCEAAVYRKDMSRPFKYGGRYPVKGGNAKFGPEMATKVAESMALRRAFNISAPTQDERWDVDMPTAEPEKPKTLAEKVAERVEAVQAPPDAVAAAEAIFEGEVVEEGASPLEQALAAMPESIPETPAADAETGEVKPKLERCPSTPSEDGMGMTQQCAREKDHDGAHKSREGSWPA